MVLEEGTILQILFQFLAEAFTYTSTELVLILLTAVLMDILIGEPPSAVHPVVWIGKLIEFLKEKAPKKHRKIYGVFMALTVIFITTAGAVLVVAVSHLSFVPLAVGILIQAFFLKATFAIKCMTQPAKEIQKKLDSDIQTARQDLIAYVSRDTTRLNKTQMISAILESVSENYVDSILTPILFYAVFGPAGLPAAYVFKAASTLDSMVGYKNEKYLHLGWFSAKFDDVLNWIPARISPFFIAIGAGFSNLFIQDLEPFKMTAGIKTAAKEHRVSLSPNSGWPMAAAAGVLQVRFEKPGEYVIGNEYRDPVSEDIIRISALVIMSSVIAALFGCAVIKIVGYVIGI